MTFPQSIHPQSDSLLGSPAADIIAQSPLTANATHQLEALQTQIPDSEARMLADLWLAYDVAAGEIEPVDPRPTASNPCKQ
ncbi:MAG: hypothetical protein L3J62_02140 [Gammaproteobacteria bacterium]|nr:hypothetical protein [Gammaproteobacteria bacterium]MCF6229585.1 hypothetical protein [Gammaproteobacteria bacterium]